MKKTPIRSYRLFHIPGVRTIPAAMAIIMLCMHTGHAQDTGTGLDFLNISPSTSLLGISEAQTATPSGAGSIYSNPALLAFEERSVLDFSYTLWIADVQNQFAAASFRRGHSAIAFGIYNSSSDEFEARDQAGPPAGVFSIGYLSISGAYAYRLGALAVGVTGQYLREEVFQHRANGYSLSFGSALSLFNNRVRTGMALMNVGEMQDLNEEATLLPTTLRFGVDAQLIDFTTARLDDLPILVSLHADYVQPLEDSPSSDFIGSDRRDPFFNVGITADIADTFQLRSGYKFGPTERPFSFGAGIMIEPAKINYALVPFTTGFGTVHSIGLQYFF